MKTLSKEQRSAVETLISGKRVAVDIATLKLRGSTGIAAGAKIRLRFDKVVIELMNRLQVALVQKVPDGMTVLLTVTAPIRLSGKTAVALVEKISSLLERKSPGSDVKDEIHGNRIQIRLAQHGVQRAPKLVGFVHNPDTDSLLLLNMTSGLLEILGAEGGRPKPRSLPRTVPGQDRWLVVGLAGGSRVATHLAAHLTPNLAAYRYICSQLRAATDFKKILMVSSDGRVESLTD